MTRGGRARRPVLAVRLPNWLGDACLAAPAVDALEAWAASGAAFASAGGAPAGADLLLVARPWAPLLFGAHWPRARWLRAPGPGGAWIAAVPSLARERAAAAVLFPPSLSARLHAACAGIPRRVGLSHGEGDFLLSGSAPRGPRGSRHLEDEYLDLARSLGATPPASRRPLTVPDAAGEAARRLLAAVGGPDATSRPRRLVVAPGARYGPAKRWPPERFAEATRLALAAAGAGGGPADWTVVLVGEPADAAACAAVRAASPAGPHLTLDLSGRSDLLALIGVLAEADLVLSNDSGVAHLAAFLGRPTAVVFGSTDPRWTAPRGPRVRVLHDPPPCAPCFRRTCGVADRYACMRRVTPEHAAAALVELCNTAPLANARGGTEVQG